MSPRPDPNLLFDLLTFLDSARRQSEDLNSLLDKVRTVLLPDARSLYAYRLDGHVAHRDGIPASADTDLPAELPFAAGRAISGRWPSYDQSRGSWMSPLYLGQDVFGLLEIGADEGSPGDDNFYRVRL